MRDIALARAQALEAARTACGDSIDARFYAKRMIDRYELVMREHGFEYRPAAPIAPPVASEADAAPAETVRKGDFATVFARFYRAVK